MEEFVKKMSEYGADTSAALERCVGDAKLYFACAKMLVEDENFAALGKALEENNPRRAFEAAHALKGAAANLGLKPMFNIVCGLVEPLRAGSCEGLADKYAELMAQRELIIRIIG